MSNGPRYLLQDLISACARGTSDAFVTRGAMETALSDFKLGEMTEVLKFIGDGGIENPKYFNTEPWLNNQDKAVVVMVDAYHFSAGATYGYLAFLKPTEKWIIKSFKKEPSGDPRNLAFADVFKGIVIETKKESK